MTEPTEYDPFVASPTQVSAYEDCPRKWGHRYLDGVKGEDSPSAIFGTNTHGHLERWLTLKVPPTMETPEQKLAAAMLKHLPPPQAVDPNNVEIELSLRLSGIYFVGKIDLWMPEGFSEVQMPVVYDHKTTSDLKWALTPEIMHEDIQATIYAAWALLKTRRERVAVQWTYGVRSSNRTRPVRAELSGRDIQDRLALTLVSAREMKALYLDKDKKALDLPYNALACEKYGGCPFRALCNLSEEERIESIMAQGSEKQMTIQERLKARSNLATKALNAPSAEVSEAEAPKTKEKTKGKEEPDKHEEKAVSALERIRARLQSNAAAGGEEKTEATGQTTTSEPAPEKSRRRSKKEPEATSSTTPTPAPSPAPAPELSEEDEQAFKLHQAKHRWMQFAIAALTGGASGEEASLAASKVSSEFTEIFGE